MDGEVYQRLNTHIYSVSNLEKTLENRVRTIRRGVRVGKQITGSFFESLGEDTFSRKLGRNLGAALCTSDVENNQEIISLKSACVSEIIQIKDFLGTVSLKRRKRYEDCRAYMRALDAELVGTSTAKLIKATLKILKNLSRKELVYTKNTVPLEASHRYIFDSNIFDELMGGKIDLKMLEKSKENGFKYYLTHVQVDEISNCPDPDKRARLVLFMQVLNSQVIPTESFVIGTSRLGFAKLSDGKMMEELRGTNIKNSEDALIGETAIKNGLTVVTNDQRLLKKVKKRGGQAINFAEFYAEIK